MMVVRTQPCERRYADNLQRLADLALSFVAVCSVEPPACLYSRLGYCWVFCLIALTTTFVWLHGCAWYSAPLRDLELM